MAVTLYSGFVPVCVQLLTGLKTVLQKCEAHATEQKWDMAAVLNLRLYPDMFTLERQFRQVCNHALGAGRVAGATRAGRRRGGGGDGLALAEPVGQRPGRPRRTAVGSLKTR